jgi:protein SCO1/2
MKPLITSLLASMLCCGGVLAADAHHAHHGADPHAMHHMQGAAAAPAAEASAAAKSAAARVELPDTHLLNQDGEPLRFGSEALGDGVVVIDFVYTRCTTVCPVLSAVFAQLQERLGSRVRLVSVSLDPVADTPARLKAYASRYASPGWTWLTGDKAEVDRTLLALGAYVGDPASHPPMILVGDVHRGGWTRFVGIASPDRVAARAEELLAARHLASQEAP